MSVKLILFLVFGYCITVFSQNKTNAIYYDISKEEYLQFKEGEMLNSAFLKELSSRQSFPYFSKEFGYYAKLYLQEEQLKVVFAANTSLSLKILPHSKALLVKVLDTVGLSIPHAKVFLNSKQLRYNRQLEAYQLKKWKPQTDQEIKVVTDQEVAFFALDVAIPYTYKYADNRDRKLIDWAARTARKTWQVTRRLIQPKLWKGKSKSYGGYLAFNQPKFRPNDTLQLKGYFLNTKGKPLNESLQVQLLQGHKVKWNTLLTPLEKGVYVLDIPLVDSLKLELDRRHTIVFNHNESRVKQLDFDYEDYQLDEVKYSLISDKESYEHGEKIMLKLDGQYTTGHRIADGEAEILLRAFPYNYHSYRNFFDDKVLLKDTIYRSQQALTTDEATQIIIPTDSFPKVEMPLRLIANFKNSNGELQQKELAIKIQKPVIKQTTRKPFQLTLDGAYVKAQVTSDTAEKSPVVEWWMEYDYDQEDHFKEVQLPYQERINSFASYYEVCKATTCVDVMMEDYEHEIVFNGKRHENKLQLQLKNPRQLPVYYQLYKGKKLVVNQQTDQSQLVVNFPANKEATYFLKYQFYWAGERVIEEATFTPVHKVLSIAIEQPDIIQPGTTVPIKIKVTNYKKEEQSGVNLTAGSINEQFEETNAFSDLNVRFKNSKSIVPKVNHEYTDVDEAAHVTKNLLLTKDWVRKTKADQQAYYQLRFPENGSWMQYKASPSEDSLQQGIAQFAPFVVQNGRCQPIYLIYCNGRLVYYYDVDTKPPYSFVGTVGENLITIRTRDYIYKAMVDLKKGKKLTFSIDALHYKHSANPIRVTRVSTTPTLKRYEQQQIKTSILVFRPLRGAHYFFQNGQPTITWNQDWRTNRLVKIGPFYSKEPIQYVLKNKFQKEISIEPDFSHQITINKDYYFEYKWKKLEKPLPVSLPIPPLDERVRMTKNFRQKKIVVEKKEVLQNLYVSFDNPNKRGGKPNGKILFYTKKSHKNRLAVLWKPNAEITYTYRPTVTSISDNAGKYELVLLYKDSSYTTTNITLTNNTLRYLNLDALPVQRDSFLSYVHQIGNTPTRVEQKKKGTNHQPTISVYTGPTRVVSGIIRDDTGEVMIGASVLVKGTTFGTVTDLDGHFTLTIPEEATLVISYTGYETEEISVSKDQSNLSLSLQEGVALSEVVVTSYNNRIANLKTNSAAASISVLSFEKENTTNFTISGTVPTTEKTLLNGMPAIELSSEDLRTNFSDHGFWMPNVTTDADGEAYFMATFPDNFTRWKTFAIGMDQKSRVGVGFSSTNAFKPVTGQLTVPRFLLEGDSVAIIGKALNFTKDTLTVQTAFRADTTLLQSNVTALNHIFIEQTNIKATPDLDSLTLVYQVQTNQYADAEERSIPIFQQGTEEQEGSFHVLEGDTTLSLSFADTITPVTIRIESNIIDLLKGNVDELIRYPHGCNEQTSSKLLAILLAKKIKEAKGESFNRDDFVNYGINRLTNSQNEDGSWGWWKGGQANVWMTAYVVNALQEAQLAGYSTRAYDRGIVYLTEQLEKQEGRSLLDILHLFSNIGHRINYNKWLDEVEATITNASLNVQLTLLKIRQAQGLPYDLEELFQTQQRDQYQQVYWSGTSYHWYDTYFQNTLLAYQILREAGDEDFCNSIERYLIRQRKRYGWGNTFQTAKVTSVILDYYLKEQLLHPQSNLFLAIDDQELIEIKTFPFEKTISAQQAIRVIHKNKGTLYCSAQQTYFNSTPEPKTDFFEITTSFWQAGQSTDTLRQGIATELLVEVKVNRAAEYVMIEVPIPGGCSYGDKVNTNYRNRYGNREVHRANYREKVAIFCEELPTGIYQYRIPLEPRFKGRFTLNPAKVEEMYFPVFFGRNGSKSITIRD